MLEILELVTLSTSGRPSAGPLHSKIKIACQRRASTGSMRAARRDG